MTDKECYCTVANDGVAVCVCKYRPCEKLKCKEQECEALKGENFTFVDLIKTQEELIDKYEQSLDEIEKIISSPCIPTISSCIECKCSSCLYKQVLNTINKAKEQ